MSITRRSLMLATTAGITFTQYWQRGMTIAQEGTPVQPLGEVEVVVEGYDSPEGPAFDKEGNFYFVNWLSSSIVCVTPDGETSEYFNTGGIPAGLAFHPDGSLYVADEGENIHGILRVTPDGASEILVNTYEDAPLNGANDLVFDGDGVLYFSDPWGSFEQPIGGFYRYFPDGNLEQIATGMTFPNGVALTADGRAAILAETGPNHLLRFEIAEDGSIGEGVEWATLPQPPGPDGMAYDKAGNLYVAHYGTGAIDIFAPDGSSAGSIAMPTPETTNCAFGGPENRWLYVTSVGSASVFRVEMPIPGQPLNDGRNYG